MKLNLSLKKAWKFFILLTVLLPASLLTLFFGNQLYTIQLNNELRIEQLANENLRQQIQSEFNRLQTVLHHKTDSLIPLMDHTARSEINRYLSALVHRESAIEEIMLLSPTAEVISIIDPYIGLTEQNTLNHEQLQQLKAHWNFDDQNNPPEFVIPLLGRSYIGSPKKHDDYIGYLFAVPVGSPVKGVMISFININKLWMENKLKAKTQDNKLIHNYLLDRRGAIITEVADSPYKIGDLMTHLAITRHALIEKPWPIEQPYIGINNQSVFGTITAIPQLNWTLVSEVIRSKIITPIWYNLIMIFAATLLGVALFIWLISMLAKKTLQSINALDIATEQIKQGDYQVDIPLCGIQELDAVTVNFDAMAKIRKASDEKLRLSSRVFSDTHEGIIITDSHKKIIDVNPAYCEITGFSHEDIIGQLYGNQNSGKQSPAFYQEMWQNINDEGYWQGELWNLKKNGDLYAELLTISSLKNEDNIIVNYVSVFTDITSSKHQQEQLNMMAHYDVLTGLPNRALFVDRFAQAIAHSKRTGKLLAVCFLDLDSFKPINDNYGHDVGDKLLIEVSERIKQSIRTEDTVSRQGGDEFALLLNDIESTEQCTHTLERIHYALSLPYFIESNYHKISASSGATLYPTDNGDIDTLVRHADQAMYKAKIAGKNRFHLFNPEHNQRSIQKHHQIDAIEHALHNNELALFYQPKVNMITGDVFGAEALIRWLHPEKGLIPPLDFLPAIEGSELELIIGDWVIEQALLQLTQWQQQNIELEVSVNISSHHLLSESFYSNLECVLTKYPSVDAKFLQLEILESSALGDLNAIIKVINVCKNNLGVKVALDDFGTGYSSLTHLRSLPANTIKIDQTFVRDVIDDPSDYAIIDGIIGLADSFNREVIAEGVEAKEHGLMLLLMGCKQAQGYGIAKPMPAEAFPAWLSQYQPHKEWLLWANKHTTVKENKLKLFKLISHQWKDNFIRNIKSTPENSRNWPIMDMKLCPCGSWIQRKKQDDTFDQNILKSLDLKHKVLHSIADSIYANYQNGNRNKAREALSELHIAFDEMTHHSMHLKHQA